MCILDNYWLGVGRSWLALLGCLLLFISLLRPVVGVFADFGLWCIAL
jgi:hypothetical protein